MKASSFQREGRVMRWLSVGRLSYNTDVTTSPERQREVNDWAIKSRGERIVAEVMDLDVSGSISPFERPELGLWLTDPDMITQWDGIVVPKIDRLSRSLLDFEVFLRWCDDHGKVLISVSEGFDLSTPIGRLIAKILMMFAEFERERMRERRSEAAEKLRALGRWNGGKAPYGYVLKGDRAGAFLYQDPGTAPVVWRIVQMVIADRYLADIARTLNEEGIPSPGSARRRANGRVNAPEWSAAGLGKMLTNRVLLGELTFQGKPVRNDDGSLIYVTDEPLIDETTWNDLQQALAAISRPKAGNHKAAHLLLRIAYCGECDAPLYYQGCQAGPHGRAYPYYRCRTAVSGRPELQHGARGIRADMLEAEVEKWLLSNNGDDQILRRAGAGRDYAGELAMAQRELEELEEQYLAHNLSAERFACMSTRLEERQAELRVLAETVSGPRWEPTGETVRERWERSDAQGRHAMLRRLGLRWYLRREYRVSDHKWDWQHEFDWLPMDQAHERLASLAA